MAFEAFQDSDRELAISLAVPLMLPVTGDGCTSAFKQVQHLDPLIRLAQMNPNLASVIKHSRVIRKSSTTGFSLGHDDIVTPAAAGVHFQTHGSTNVEPCFMLRSSPISFSNNNQMNGSSASENFPYICEGSQRGNKREHVERTTNSDSENYHGSLSAWIKEEPGTIIPFLKKPRLDGNQENIQQQQQQIIHELLFKNLRDHNPQINAMFKQYGQLNQLQQPILHSVPQLRGLHVQLAENKIRNIQQDLDGGICSRRFIQYLYHFRNRPHDNNIGHWKKFVSKYYAPCSMKMWCFSTYGNFELRGTRVFCPKSMEAWCCGICGSRSGKGLEATSEIFPRLFKLKFESGMHDEILFLDFPIARKLPSGSLVLEYGKAVQESVYETFRVIHEGRLRIVFRHDLKILSWEFCAWKHEEFLLRRFITPQVNELVQGAQQYENDIQNYVSDRVTSENMQKNCNMFLSAGHKLAREMELPLVNALGYPKRFIRCLQIAEVFNNLKDLMTFCHVTKIGPIESLKNYSKSSKTGDHMEKRGLPRFVNAQNQDTDDPRHHHAKRYRTTDYGVAFGSKNSVPDFNNQLLGHNNPSITSARKGSVDRSNHPTQTFDSPPAPQYSSPRSESSEHYENPRQAEHSKKSHKTLVDKLLHDMVASRRRKTVQETSRKTGKVTSPTYGDGFRSLVNRDMGNRTTSKENSNTAASASRRVNLHNASEVSHNIMIKTEPCSPEEQHEAFWSCGSPKMEEDLQW